MRNWVLCLGVVFGLVVVFGLTAGSAHAQSADLFAGYSFLNGDSGDSRETSHGWMANISGNVTDHVGIVGDFAGHYESGLDFYEYMGGIRFNARSGRANPFVEALAGGVRSSGFGSSDNNFLLGFGGGVDVRAHDVLSIRVVQFDWLPVKGDDEWETSIIRLGFGLTFHFE